MCIYIYVFVCIYLLIYLSGFLFTHTKAYISSRGGATPTRHLEGFAPDIAEAHVLGVEVTGPRRTFGIILGSLGFRA